jgi:RNA polymerase sigma-70 factor (ECF subfamily)
MRGDGSNHEVEPQVVRAVEPFDSFFRREFPKMVAVAYAVSGSRWAAEELAQDALTRAYRSWDTIGRYDKPGAWLRRVTINFATSHVRRRVSEVKAVERFALRRIEPPDPHPEEDMEFWQQVKRLPRRQRQAVALRYVDDLSTGEIAEVMEISESSVRTHLQRGREALTDSLGSGGDR